MAGSNEIKSPGKFPRVYFMPIRTRTRRQDPGRLFICCQDQKRHTGPPAARQRPAAGPPAIYAARRRSGRFCYASLSLSEAAHAVFTVGGYRWPRGGCGAPGAAVGLWRNSTRGRVDPGPGRPAGATGALGSPRAPLRGPAIVAIVAGIVASHSRWHSR